MDAVLGNVGRELRALRLARRVSLADLARDTGYSEGYLSQVENGATVPALSALSTLAASLGSDMTAFFPREDHPRVHLARAGDPHKVRIAPNAREEYTLLTPRDPDATFTALVHRLYPTSEVVRYRHVGERFALLLDGEVELTVGGESFVLRPGDTVHYSSLPEHELRVSSNGPAEILWFVSPAII
jgi:transcriptional regulator with XRE-family HTH domain